MIVSDLVKFLELLPQDAKDKPVKIYIEFNNKDIELDISEAKYLFDRVVIM